MVTIREEQALYSAIDHHYATMKVNLLMLRQAAERETRTTHSRFEAQHAQARLRADAIAHRDAMIQAVLDIFGEIHGE